MIESFAPFLSGAGGVGAGSLTMWLVMRERLSNLIATQNERDLRYTERLDNHDHEIEEIKERKHCGPCNDLTIERRKYDEQQQQQLKASMVELKSEMVTMRQTVSTCFEDLIKEMRRRD